MITNSLYQLLLILEEKKRQGHRIVPMPEETPLPSQGLIGWRDLDTCETMQITWRDLVYDWSGGGRFVTEELDNIKKHLCQNSYDQWVEKYWTPLRSTQGRQELFTHKA